jgi:hypothetical protein
MKRLIGELLYLAVIVAFGVVIGTMLTSELTAEQNYAEAHAYADGVLVPRMDAAYNDWRYQHPKDRKDGSWDHVHRNDVGDRERWRLVRRSFRELEERMRAAGYE